MLLDEMKDVVSRLEEITDRLEKLESLIYTYIHYRMASPEAMDLAAHMARHECTWENCSIAYGLYSNIPVSAHEVCSNI